MDYLQFSSVIPSYRTLFFSSVNALYLFLCRSLPPSLAPIVIGRRSARSSLSDFFPALLSLSFRFFLTSPRPERERRFSLLLLFSSSLLPSHRSGDSLLLPSAFLRCGARLGAPHPPRPRRPPANGRPRSGNCALPLAQPTAGTGAPASRAPPEMGGREQSRSFLACGRPLFAGVRPSVRRPQSALLHSLRKRGGEEEVCERAL